MSDPSALQFCATSLGYVVRVIGKGTLKQSPTVREFTMRCVKDEGLTIVLDLSSCGYLDSTFLGCLVGLNQNCCPSDNRRFKLFVPPGDRSRLFGLTQIDSILHFVDDLPQGLDEFRALGGETLNTEELGRHVMDSHERLAQLGGPDAASFQSVADRLRKEEGGRRKAEGGRRKEEGGRRKEEGGRRKEDEEEMGSE